ncbi:MAG: branched-chain amino acid aminotransferase [Candidatus Izemoplasmatales bacterium]|nr:branched-chain amino acid aminotransferase [Candidatus Izemoplasmatales bacterium]MDD3865425.1 branched-chain amino acid aminotransferase [Candidatus Izemoplasmatales bacterium]
MDKPEIIKLDYQNLGFSYIKLKYNYISYYRNGQWDEGVLRGEDTVTIAATSTCLHYGQEAFEGMKAFRRQDGGIQLFRPDENAKRLQRSCKRLLMPEIPIDKFINAVKLVVKANQEYVPPYESKASLYIRPYILGIGDNMGVRPAKEYLFGIICTPVGAYFKGGLAPVNFNVTEYDRAAPNGTGDIKVGGNYAASLHSHEVAKEKGFADCIYLDPLTHTKIDEAGAANFFAITRDNRLITPYSKSILPSITRMSIMQIARDYLGMVAEHQDVYIDKLDEYTEAGACGTAAVISPIGGIEYQGKMHVFHSLTEVGPITRKLYDLLTGIQYGDVVAPEGWIYLV